MLIVAYSYTYYLGTKIPERGITMTNTTTMSIFAQALSDNRNYKNARVDGATVGVANYRKWVAAVKALRIPAYAIRVYRHDHMSDTTTVTPCDQTPLYDALKSVLEMMGEVNGAKLDAHNCAEEIISVAVRFRSIDTSEAMAHARCEKKLAKKALDDNDTEENQKNYDHWVDEVKNLESLPGNCKKIAEIQSESAFVKAVELLLGDAITKQCMKSADQVAAEEQAKKDARKAKAKANRAAKRQATKNNAQ